jgi:hypothetical protein
LRPWAQLEQMFFTSLGEFLVVEQVFFSCMGEMGVVEQKFFFRPWADFSDNSDMDCPN